MPNQVKRHVNAAWKRRKAQQKPEHASSPSVERDNNPVQANNKANCEGEIQKSDEKKHWTSYAEAICAMALVIITGVYTWYAAKQSSGLVASNAINREALEAVQRSFMTFANIRADEIPVVSPSGDRAWMFTARVENSGTTPAIQAVSSFKLETRCCEPAEAEFLQAAERSFPSAVGPKEEQLIGPVRRSDTEILGMKLSDFKNNEVTSDRNEFGWGWIVYRDVFPRTKVHVTEFCQRLSNFSLNGKGKEVKFYFEGCEHHNCTDETCADYEQMASKMTGNP